MFPGILRQLAMVVFVAGLCGQLASANDRVLRLEPILECEGDRGVILVAQSEAKAMKPQPTVIGTAFVVVVSQTWPEGMVPVFALDAEHGSFELRRLPPRGLENSADPIFFGLPRIDETNAAKIAGTWSITATNANRSVHHMTWELAADDSSIGGRFDPASEYRVAYVTSGRFESNVLQLQIDYSNDRYEVSGQWNGGRMEGAFKQFDGDDRGVWAGIRGAAPAWQLPSKTRIVPLFEWTRSGGREKRYCAGDISPGDGWRRGSRPLCRVWRVE
jgi:hypothetical protein